VKIGAIIAIFIGIVIILSGISSIAISFWFVVQLIFAALDAFGFWGVNWDFWELFIAMIGSYLVGWGLMSIFGNSRFMKKSPKSSRQNLSISRPLEADEYEVNIDANLTKVLLLDTQRDKGFDATLGFDKKSFSGSLTYNMEGKNAVIKAKCSSPIVRFNATLDGVDAVLDFSSIKLDNATIKSNISRLSIVPSEMLESPSSIRVNLTGTALMSWFIEKMDTFLET